MDRHSASLISTLLITLLVFTAPLLLAPVLSALTETILFTLAMIHHEQDCGSFAPLFFRLVWPCNRTVFDAVVYNYCLPVYNKSMATSNYQHECPWPSTISIYNRLDKCVNTMASATSCREAAVKNKVFLELHRTYFSRCSFMQDPDMLVLMALILPCIAATFLMPCLCTYLATTSSMKL